MGIPSLFPYHAQGLVKPGNEAQLGPSLPQPLAASGSRDEGAWSELNGFVNGPRSFRRCSFAQTVQWQAVDSFGLVSSRLYRSSYLPLLARRKEGHFSGIV